MALHRRAAKRDASEAEIVRYLKVYGFSVQRISATGAPDLVCGRHGVTRVIEVKTGKAALRATQREWWERWQGNRVIVLRTPGQVATLVKYWGFPDVHLSLALAEGPRQEKP